MRKSRDALRFRPDCALIEKKKKKKERKKALIQQMDLYKQV